MDVLLDVFVPDVLLDGFPSDTLLLELESLALATELELLELGRSIGPFSHGWQTRYGHIPVAGGVAGW